MRLAGSIVIIVAAVGWVATGLFLLLAGAGLGPLFDPQSQPEAVLLGAARFGLAALLSALAILALKRPGHLPGTLALGAVACVCSSAWWRTAWCRHSIGGWRVWPSSVPP